MGLHEEKREGLAQVRAMREWVMNLEHLLDCSWASSPTEISNTEVGRRLDDWLKQLAIYLEGAERTDHELLRLGHLLKVITNLRPGLVQCYDRADFPRTNNDLERTIRAVKMHYRRISGRKNWNTYLLRYGRCVVYQEWWHQQPNGWPTLQARLLSVPTQQWRQARQQTRHCHLEQLNRSRFRRHPLAYLATLEACWQQTCGT